MHWKSKSTSMYLLFLRSFFFEDFHAVPLSCIYCPHVHIQSCIAYAEHLAHLFFSCSTFHLWNEKRMSTSQGRFIFHNTDYFLSYHWTFISLFSHVSLSLTLVRLQKETRFVNSYEERWLRSRSVHVHLYCSNRKIISCLYNEMMPGFSFF